MRVLSLVGTRPDIIKMAPVIKELDADPFIQNVLVDSGQHYDRNMNDIFHASMDLRAPNYRFVLKGKGSVTHIAQTMENVGRCIKTNDIELVIVLGDTDTALAGALVANKLGIPIAHVEAGLRSFDRRMPEEHNRVIIDHLSDLLFTPSDGASDNLKAEGIQQGVHMVGNTVTDALLWVLPRLPPPPRARAT